MAIRRVKAIEILQQWAAFVNAGDVDGAVSLFADDAILLPTFSSSILSDKESIHAYFTMLGNRPGAKVTIDDAESIVATDVIDETVSIAGKYTFHFEVDGKLTAYPSRFTFVMVLNQDKPISHQHSSILPA